MLTATVDGIDSRTGHSAELPVLSLATPRSEIERLDFERLDPSDAIENFQHRGDVMTSRKSEGFVPIIPLSAADIAPPPPETMDFSSLLARVKQLHDELTTMLKPAITATTAVVKPSDLSS